MTDETKHTYTKQLKNKRRQFKAMLDFNKYQCLKKDKGKRNKWDLEQLEINSWRR